MGMLYDIRITYFQLLGNLTDDSIILDTVRLQVKNHLYLDVSSDDLYLVSGENKSMHPNVAFTHQIKDCYYMYLKSNKADCIEPCTIIYFRCRNLKNMHNYCSL